jgi:uncharacterized protein YcfL
MEEKLKGALWGMLICFIITLMFGCRSVKYVPVTSVKTDSIFIYDTSKVVNKIRYTDSLRIIDSIIVVQDTAGKTIYKEKHHSETRTKSNEMKNSEKQKTGKTEKTNNEVETPIYIEKKLGWWDKLCINVFPFLAAFTILLCVAIAWMLRGKLKKK